MFPIRVHILRHGDPYQEFEQHVHVLPSPGELVQIRDQKFEVKTVYHDFSGEQWSGGTVHIIIVETELPKGML